MEKLFKYLFYTLPACILIFGLIYTLLNIKFVKLLLIIAVITYIIYVIILIAIILKDIEKFDDEKYY